jgi:hypothetical protein
MANEQPNLIWIDCEMTGLDLEKDVLVEIAVLVTDSELNVIGEGIDLVIAATPEQLAGMNVGAWGDPHLYIRQSQSLNPNNYQLQNYNAEDESLIQNFSTEIIFDSTQDYLEYFVLDLNSNVLYSNTAGYNNYTILGDNIVIDPQKDLEVTGYSEGAIFTSGYANTLVSDPNIEERTEFKIVKVESLLASLIKII